MAVTLVAVTAVHGIFRGNNRGPIFQTTFSKKEFLAYPHLQVRGLIWSWAFTRAIIPKKDRVMRHVNDLSELNTLMENSHFKKGNLMFIKSLMTKLA